MKIRYLRDHLDNKAGDLSDNNLTAERLSYLIRVGVVEEVMEDSKNYAEKHEVKQPKEKAENKTGNVPTAKAKKK